MKKTLKISLFCLALLASHSVSMAVALNEEKVIDLPVSAKGLTRLSVKGEVIQDIFIYPMVLQNVALSEAVQLHKSGHVFMAPCGIKEPFYLTLMTQKGHVQDLKVLPSTSSAQPVVLELPAPLSNSSEQEETHRPRLESYVRAALQGVPPRGFTVHPAAQPSARPLGSLQLKEVSVYRSRDYIIHVFEIENPSSGEISLMPEMFLGHDDLAVVFETAVLKTEEKTHMALLSQNIHQQKGK